MHSAVRPQAKRRRGSFWPAAVLVLPALVAGGCETMSPTGEGALTGGALGAGAGAIVGAAAGRPVLGALAGGAIGAGTGAVVGNGVERSERREAARAAQAQALGLADIVTLTQQHLGDEVIINQIRASGTIYYLRAEDIVWLRQNGVSEAVIMEMQATATRYPRRIYSAQPYYPGAVYVVEPPPPPPPVGVGVGIGIGGRFR
jgi:osmotically inducible lipoprotein OsmB